MPGPGTTFDLQDPRTCGGFVSDLVVRCGRGDDTALATLFDLFHPMVSSVALAEAPSKDVTDVVLAAFRRIWERASAYDPGRGSAVDWVFTELAGAVAEQALAADRSSDRVLALC